MTLQSGRYEAAAWRQEAVTMGSRVDEDVSLSLGSTSARHAPAIDATPRHADADARRAARTHKACGAARRRMVLIGLS